LKESSIHPEIQAMELFQKLYKWQMEIRGSKIVEAEARGQGERDIYQRETDPEQESPEGDIKIFPSFLLQYTRHR